MKRKQAIASIAAVMVVISAGGLFVATRNHDRSESDIGAQKKQSQTTKPPDTNNTATTATTLLNLSTTTTIDHAPEAHTFRTPVHCASAGDPSGSLPGDSPMGKKKWVTVQALSGACDLASNSFHLRGIDTRLAWRSDATSFAAFLLDKKTGLDGTAGFADAECSAKCADYQSLTNQAGDFTLRVQADGGPWQVLVQEYR